MYRKAHPLFMICHTPTHLGTGSDLGIVDLPIQRERHTKFPKFEGSSVKGAFREAFERKLDSKNKGYKTIDAPETMIHRLFGYDDHGLADDQKKQLKYFFKNKKDEEQTSFAGALGFSDARLLLFPVKSMKGVFAWVTCFRALKQFEKDLQLSNTGFHFKGLNEDYLKEERQQTYLFSPNSSLLINGKVILEEFTFKVANELNGTVQVIEKEGASPVDFPDWLTQHLFDNDGSYWCDKLKTDIVVLPDDDFTDFVNQSTEVITRTKIDNNTGTVAKGALFTEEYLPSDSIMYTLALTASEFREQNAIEQDEVFDFFNEHLPEVIQIGGNATLGKGIVRTKLLNL